MFLLFRRILLTFIYTENPNPEQSCTSSLMNLTPWNSHQPSSAVAILLTLSFIFLIINLGYSIPFPFSYSHCCPRQAFHSGTSDSEERKAYESWRPFFLTLTFSLCLSWQRHPYIIFFHLPLSVLNIWLAKEFCCQKFFLQITTWIHASISSPWVVAEERNEYIGKELTIVLGARRGRAQSILGVKKSFLRSALRSLLPETA